MTSRVIQKSAIPQQIRLPKFVSINSFEEEMHKTPNKKIISAINNLPECDQNAKQIVLFLPENETHEIGLLLANYIFKSQNIRTIYFGQQVPISNLIEFLNQKRFNHR